jgi:hypothetical protein
MGVTKTERKARNVNPHSTCRENKRRIGAALLSLSSSAGDNYEEEEEGKQCFPFSWAADVWAKKRNKELTRAEGVNIDHGWRKFQPRREANCCSFQAPVCR